MTFTGKGKAAAAFNPYVCLRSDLQGDAPAAVALGEASMSAKDDAAGTGRADRVTMVLQCAAAVRAADADSVVQVALEYDPEGPELTSARAAVLHACEGSERGGCTVVDSQCFERCCFLSLTSCQEASLKFESTCSSEFGPVRNPQQQTH